MDKFKILSIDGGGIRGLVPALILAELEEKTGRLCHELFDLVGGTSTGGILAAGIGAGIPCKTIAEIYINRGEEIFEKNKGAWWKFVINEKYSNEGLIRVSHEYLGELPLNSSLCSVLTTAYDIEKRQNKIFSSRLTPHVSAKDAAIASAVAPTYFEPYLVNNSPCIDGGASGLNNPTLICLDEAQNIKREDDKREDFILSLGTGSFEKSISYQRAVNWGLAQWIRPLIDIMIDGSSEMVHQAVSSFCNNYHRIQFNLSSRKVAKMDDASPVHLRQLQDVAFNVIQREDKRLNFIASKL
jgi:patatin-like phospholipase/acyl hydrolase